MGRDHGGRGGQNNSQQKKLTYKQKSSISYVQASDPPFLRAIKEKFGYQEPKLEDKDEEKEDEAGFSGDPDDICNMKKEDRPQIVVLNKDKHVTEEELDEEVKKHLEEEDRKKIEDGRITFKKPIKRTAEVESEESKKKKKMPTPPPTSNSSRLLSFGDDEDHW